MAAGVSVMAVALIASAPAYALNNQTAKAKTSEATAPLSLSTLSTETNAATRQQSKIYQWSVKGRWGLKLDLNQDEARPSGWNDVDAGAFYKISPSVRVGGTVGFGEKTKSLQPRDPAADKDQPRVRLETTFKF
ncbi:NtrZ family periplasmic regulatory protein [Asticcacaulis sp. W401b]|uniref:NtrZ family periplasmic regulatory protein n=1 Tax=Asticcacaulis sp. W401b TaxID=3388666 RepID=UPI0039709EB3